MRSTSQRIFLFVLALSLSACAGIKTQRNNNPRVESAGPVATAQDPNLEKHDELEATASKEATAEVAEAQTVTTDNGVDLPVEQVGSIARDTLYDSKAAHAATSSHSAKVSVPAEKALGWLKNGNARFTKNKLRNDGQSAKDIQRLSSGQHPHTIVLSCSDSRVPPELVFDQKLGEIFVIRTAGEALDSAAIASIEYAVAHLGPQLIVVMGHDSCGAVKATLETPEGKTAGSPSLDKLVADIRPRLPQSARTPSSKELTKEVSANAQGVARDLVARSAIIAEKVNDGSLKIESAVYHLSSGKVDFLK